MVRRIATAVFMGGFLFAAASFGADHAYQGLKKCSMCHKGEKKGEIFEKWQASAHAKAFETLASEEAKAVYTKLGKTGNPQEDATCLSCHVTGHGVASEVILKEEGVSCEACHGPGADYGKMAIMKDKAASVAAGLVENPKGACISCHNDKSPTFKGFDAEEFYKKIEHHTPKG